MHKTAPMSMLDVIHKSTEQAFAKPLQSPPTSKQEETKVDEPHTPESKPETTQVSVQENVGVSNSNDEPRDVSVESVVSTDTSETSSSASPSYAPATVPEDKPPKKERKKREKQPPTTEPWKRFSCECSVVLVNKLHNICSKENVSLRSLVEKMFRDGIRSYERKHGVAECASKRTAEDLY